MTVHAGDVVRMVSMRGRIVFGTVVATWPVRSGALCVKIKPSDGPPLTLVAARLDIVGCVHRKVG